MSESPETPSSLFPLSVRITLAATAVCLVSGYFWYATGDSAAAMTCLLSQTVLVSVLIWQACDPFADAAQFIGHEFHLPGSVRGATLDAIASSMPELFTGIFFVVVVVFGPHGQHTEAARAEMSGEGFKATIATCAGSAVYNMILIPAICALVISFHRKSRPTIDVERRVITRDGAWFVVMEILLIWFLMQKQIHWWMGVIFLLSYLVYIIVLYVDARAFRSRIKMVERKINEGMTSTEAFAAMRADGHAVTRDLERRFRWTRSSSQETRVEIELEDEDDEYPESTELFFGFKEFKLNPLRAWIIILLATLLAASACYWLVEITREIADRLEIDVFFVAVILAAAASSVPDTFLSIGSAQSGDDDGAVANAFGSNIFDISICISIPLLVACYLNDWQPITIEQSGEIAGLQIMLAGLTIVTLGIIWHKLQLTRTKALVLCGLYLLFIAYAVIGSFGWIQLT